MDQLNSDVWITVFKVNLEHIGTFGSYDHVSATCLIACLVTVATDPLVSREKFTCFHILLRVLLKVFYFNIMWAYLFQRERYQSDLRRCLALGINTSCNQKEMCCILDKILESRETSSFVVAVGIITTNINLGPWVSFIRVELYSAFTVILEVQASYEDARHFRIWHRGERSHLYKSII